MILSLLHRSMYYISWLKLSFDLKLCKRNLPLLHHLFTRMFLTLLQNITVYVNLKEHFHYTQQSNQGWVQNWQWQLRVRRKDTDLSHPTNIGPGDHTSRPVFYSIMQWTYSKLSRAQCLPWQPVEGSRQLPEGLILSHSQRTVIHTISGTISLK